MARQTLPIQIPPRHIRDNRARYITRPYLYIN